VNGGRRDAAWAWKRLVAYRRDGAFGRVDGYRAAGASRQPSSLSASNCASLSGYNINYAHRNLTNNYAV